MNLSNLLDKEYIFSQAYISTYESWYLYIALALIFFSVGYFVFTKVTKRIKAYKLLDKYIIWGYLTLGLAGLFIWFSRSQGLPTFSIRFFSYLWLASIVTLDIFLTYYYKKKIPGEIKQHFEKNRKEKYLK